MIKKYSYEVIAAIVSFILGIVIMLASVGELNGTIFAIVTVAIISGFADVVYGHMMGKPITWKKFLAGFVPGLVAILLVNIFC